MISPRSHRPRARQRRHTGTRHRLASRTPRNVHLRGLRCVGRRCTTRTRRRGWFPCNHARDKATCPGRTGSRRECRSCAST